MSKYEALMSEKDWYEQEALKVADNNPKKAELFKSIAEDYERRAKALRLGDA